MDLSKIRQLFRKEDDLSEAQKNRKLLLSLALRIIVLVMIAILLVYAGISFLLGSSLFLPNSANAVLDSAAKDGNKTYRWVSESRREIEFPKTEIKETQLAYRVASVDGEKNRFWARAYNVLSDPPTFWSNGWSKSPELERYTAYVTETQLEELTESGSNESGFLLTDPCTGQEPINSSRVSLPDPSLFKEAQPVLETDKGTFQGERAWLLSFKPTAEIIEQMLWLPFWKEVYPKAEFPLNWNYILSEREEAAISKEQYSESEGLLWVTRDDRQLAQILVDFRTQNNDFSSRWRLLSRIETDESIQIEDMRVSKPKC